MKRVLLLACLAIVLASPATAQQSPPPPPPSAPVVPFTARLHPAALGEVARGCSLARFIAQAGEQCVAIAVVPPNAAMAHAFDRDGCTSWNSGGFAPQTVSGAFSSPQRISGFVLVPEMTPHEADATQIVELSSDGTTFDRAYTLHASMRSGRAEAVALPPGGATARAFRIRTTASPSWVAWREVVPVACTRMLTPPPVVVSAPPTPVASDARITPGRGACRVDSDCVAATCCHPSQCVSVSMAPQCGGLACTRSCQGPMDCGRGGCLCQHGRCASWTHAHPEVLVPGDF